MKCPVCKEKYKSTPLFLPCGWTVCDTHFKNDDLKQCFACGIEHNANECKINQQVLTMVKSEQQRKSCESFKEKVLDLKNSTLENAVQHIENIYGTRLKEFETRMKKVQSIIRNYLKLQANLINAAKEEHLKRFKQDEQKFLTDLSNVDFDYAGKNYDTMRRRLFRLNINFKLDVCKN